jgi:hypothetical protein
VAGKSVLGIKDNVLATKDALKWKWSNGAATTLAELGDPTTTDGYFLCIYDAGVRVSSTEMAPGGTCGGKPCWKASATAFKYKNAALVPDGKLAATLKAGVAEKAAIKVVGKGTGVDTPDPSAFVGPVRVQLQRADDAICFEALYKKPFKKNVNGVFTAVASPSGAFLDAAF